MTAEETLAAIYVVSKRAGECDELARENRRNGAETRAKVNTYRKTALYDLKAAAIATLLQTDGADGIELHTIKGHDHYYFRFDGWGYHLPVEDIDIGDRAIADERALPGFEKDTSTPRTDMSLAEALVHLRERLCLHANDYLPERTVTYGSQAVFIGWREGE